MTMRVTMLSTRMGESGTLLTAGSTYTVSDAFGAYLVGYKYATDTDLELTPPSSEDHPYVLRDASGNVTGLSAGGDEFPITRTYTWNTLQALTGVTGGTRAYVSDLGNLEFIYDATKSEWLRNSSFVMSAHAVPFVLPPTGTVGNNGALTLGGTGIISYAGAAGFATKCFMYFALGQLYTSSPPNWYYTEMSSATVGVVYSNVFSAQRFGSPTLPTPTPLVSTGPGAYTGVTTTVVFPSSTIPGKLLGVNGQIRCAFTVDVKNTAGSKTIGAQLGGISTFFSAIASSQAYGFVTTTRNVASRSKQVTLYGGYGDIGSAGQNTYTTSVDTTTDKDFALSAVMAVATDYVVVTGYTLEIISA